MIWPLAILLAAHVKITGTFAQASVDFATCAFHQETTEVNLGAGTCLHPDPLYQLLASQEGQMLKLPESSTITGITCSACGGSGFLGLAVEADSARLQRPIAQLTWHVFLGIV